VAEPCESDIWRKKTLRKRHFAKICANSEDESNTAPMPWNLAEAYSELMRAPARPSGKTKEPQPGQQHAPWPTPGGGEATGARGDYIASGRGSAARSKAARPCWVITAMSLSARASTAERSGSSAGACCSLISKFSLKIAEYFQLFCCFFQNFANFAKICWINNFRQI